MDFSDAITITALGMGVVFSGLLLTAGLITLLGRFQGAIDDTTKSSKDEPTSEPPAAGHGETTAGPPLEPEILTVIATILEVEHRLRRVTSSSRARST